MTGELLEEARAASAAHDWAKACLAGLDGRRGDRAALAVPPPLDPTDDHAAPPGRR